MEKTICVSGEALTLPEINKRLDRAEREKQDAYFQLGLAMGSLIKWLDKAMKLDAECAELEAAFRALMKLYDIGEKENAGD